MKRFFKLMLIAIAVSFGMMSCSTNSVEDEPNPVTPDPETKTLNIRVVSNDFTRAEGDVADNAIQTLYLAFYKGEDTTPLYIKEATMGSNNTYSVEIPSNMGENPDKVIAFANITDRDLISNALSASTIDELQNGNDALVMSSAVYFDDEKLVNYSSVTSENIYGDISIDIYLDRLATKVTVEKDKDVKMPKLTVNGDETLDMDIINWGLIGTDKSSYLLKQIASSSFNLDWAKKDYSLSWAESVNHGKFSNTSDLNKISLGEANISLSSSTYSHETTRNEEEMQLPNSKPSIILVGEYKKNGTAIGTCYRLRSGDKNQIFTEDELMQKIAVDKDILFVKSTDESIKNAELSDIKNALTLSTPSIDGKTIPDYGVTPQLKPESEISDITFCDSKGNEYKRDVLNTLLCNRYGILEKYYEGKCIFIVPIVHSEENNIYGLVRNHTYTLKIQSIAGFGRGIADATSIISEETIPELESTYTINSTLHVNSWTEIGQDINITPSE